jgi:arabinofuranan 3-O-arabinosyltransferase
VARIVDDGSLAGSAIVLPLDDFYQVPTTWGYYGSDLVPTQLITRPTIARHPDAYIGDPNGFSELRDAVENGLVGRDPVAAYGAMRALGVAYVVVRKDIDYNSPIRTVNMAHPDAIRRGLNAVAGVRLVASTPVADVYGFNAGDAPVAALSGMISAQHTDAGALAVLAATAPKGTAIVTRDHVDEQLLEGHSWSVDINRGQTIRPPVAGQFLYERHANGAPVVELHSSPRGLVLHDPVTVRVGQTTIASRPDTVVPGRGPAVAASINGSFADLTRGNAYVHLTTGSAVTTYSAGRSGVVGPWSSVHDCNHYDNKPASISADFIVTPDNQEALRLRAARHSACVSAPIQGGHPGDVMRISLEQRAVRGARPRTCVWEPKRQQCASLAWSAQPSGEWYDLSAVYDFPRDAGAPQLFLYADQPAKGSGRMSENWYRNITVSSLVAGSTTVMPATSSPTGLLDLHAAPAKVSTAFDATSPFVGARSDASDCDRHSDRSPSALGIHAVTSRIDDPTAVTITARHDTGCVFMPVFGLQRGLDYELSITTRVIAGGTPRICLWEQPAGQCAPLDMISEPHGASGQLVVRGRAAANATNWRLFLYADAGSHGAAIEYRQIHLRIIADESLIVRQASTAHAQPPKLTWQANGSDRFRIHVANARGPFVLALTDAFSKDWHVHGLPAGASAHQIELDGYRNGWVIDARGNLDLTVDYGPARFGRDARHISEVALVLLVLTAFTPIGRGLWRWRRGTRRRTIRTGPRRVRLPDSGLGGERQQPVISL